MNLSVTLNALVVSVESRSWEAYRRADGTDVPGGTGITLHLLAETGHAPVSVSVPNANGWWKALQTAQFGDPIAVDVEQRSIVRGGRAESYLKLLDLRVPAPAKVG